MMFDPQSDDIRKRDKLVVAVHEASHAFVGGALALSIESVQLSMNPNGGLEEKHWVGSTTFPGYFVKLVDNLPPDIAKEEAMKLRLFSLAGFVGECMFTSNAADTPAEADDILD